MSAGTLRRAATMIRERAEAATPGPWMSDPDAPSVILKPDKPGYSWDGTVVATTAADDFGLSDGWDAEHIASWHPAVALAVADWLEVGARRIEWHAENGGVPYVDDTYALAVANAYLGETDE